MAFIFNPRLQLKGQTFVCFLVSFLSCLPVGTMPVSIYSWTYLRDLMWFKKKVIILVCDFFKLKTAPLSTQMTLITRKLLG